MSSPIVRAILLSACFGVLLGCGGDGDDNDGPPLFDPLYSNQWHLKNTGQNGGTVGEDVNVEPVWNGGRKGEGVRIAIVDDGLEIRHEDLSANVVGGASYNYLIGNYGDPTAGAHGTAVAGVAAARDMNGVGVRGVAPRASLVGYNLLQQSTVANQADAMTRGQSINWISNNSWGTPDNRGTFDAPDISWYNAIDTGLAQGRGGLGLIYTWAAGNGAPMDNSNYDGQANYRGVIAVCAVGHDGIKASYSEPGANLWVCAPSSNSLQEITTTDLSGADGYNIFGSFDYTNTNYTGVFGGTSSATPLVAGVIALMLEARSDLTWRDVRLILAETARKNQAGDPDWMTNGAGYHIHHNYGFGVVDAAAAVSRALTWTTVGTTQTNFTAQNSPGPAIPDNDATGVSNTINVSGSGIGAIEYVEITFTSDHAIAGQLEVKLRNDTTSTESILAVPHSCFDSSGSQISCTAEFASGWTFGSGRHLGEATNGNWTLTVKDLVSGTTGTFQSWQLKFYGRP